MLATAVRASQKALSVNTRPGSGCRISSSSLSLALRVAASCCVAAKRRPDGSRPPLLTSSAVIENTCLRLRNSSTEKNTSHLKTEEHFQIVADVSEWYGNAPSHSEDGCQPEKEEDNRHQLLPQQENKITGVSTI